VVGAFDGGAITSDAGALLLGETDRAIGLTSRFAACFTDGRAPELVEHLVDTIEACVSTTRYRWLQAGAAQGTATAGIAKDAREVADPA